MKRLLALIMFILGTSGYGWEATEASIEVAKLYNYRYSAAPQYTLLGNNPDKTEYWTHQISLNVKVNLISTKNYRFYWDNEVEGQSTNKQFRRIHYDFEVGHEFGRRVQLFWEHRSEHLLDTILSEYPVKDAIGIRMHFIPQ